MISWEVNDRRRLEARALSSNSPNDWWMERWTEGQMPGWHRDRQTQGMTNWYLAIKWWMRRKSSPKAVLAHGSKTCPETPPHHLKISCHGLPRRKRVNGLIKHNTDLDGGGIQWKYLLQLHWSVRNDWETTATRASLPGFQWGLFVEHFEIRGGVHPH